LPRKLLRSSLVPKDFVFAVLASFPFSCYSLFVFLTFVAALAGVGCRSTVRAAFYVTGKHHLEVHITTERTSVHAISFCVALEQEALALCHWLATLLFQEPQASHTCFAWLDIEIASLLGRLELQTGVVAK